jgi:NADH-quinone oxidoreductase subunit M
MVWIDCLKFLKNEVFKMLFGLFYLSLFSFFLIFFIPKKNIILIKQLSLILSFLIFIYCVYLFFLLDHLYVGFQFKETFFFLNGLSFSVGVDCISIFFVLLTAILFPICFLVNWESIKYRSKDFCLMLLLLEFFLLNVFLSLDIFFFYIFFEGVLIPMFFIIGI